MLCTLDSAVVWFTIIPCQHYGSLVAASLMSPIVIDLTADSESNHEGNSSSDSDSDSAIARDSASDSGSDSDSDSSGSDSDEPQGDENLPGRDDASDSSSDVVPASDDGSGMARHVEVITISDSDSDTTQRPAPRPHLSSPARSSSSPDPSGAVRVTAGHHDSGALGDAYPPPEHSDVPMDVDVLGRSPTPSIEDSKFDAQPSISNHRTTGQIEAEIALWFSSTPSRKRPASSSPSKSRRPVKRALRESSSPALGVESDDEEKAVEDQVVIWTAGSFKDDEGLELAGCGVSFGKDDRRCVVFSIILIAISLAHILPEMYRSGALRTLHHQSKPLPFW